MPYPGITNTNQQVEPLKHISAYEYSTHFWSENLLLGELLDDVDTIGIQDVLIDHPGFTNIDIHVP